MFYLISQTAGGTRLIDFSEKADALIPQIEVIAKDNPESTPAVLNDMVMKSGFMVDGFGIPVQEADGYLVALTDL